VLGKGGKERVVPLGEEAAHWLAHYLREGRPRLARGAENALFVSARGRRLDTSTLRRVIPHPHRLRHAFATHLLEEAPICASSRSSSATARSRRHRSTATWTAVA
jgi:integrase/recombinase XerD